MSTIINTNLSTKAQLKRKPAVLCTYTGAIGLSMLVCMHRVVVASPVGVF